MRVFARLKNGDVHQADCARWNVDEATGFLFCSRGTVGHADDMISSAIPLSSLVGFWEEDPGGKREHRMAIYSTNKAKDHVQYDLVLSGMGSDGTVKEGEMRLVTLKTRDNGEIYEYEFGRIYAENAAVWTIQD